MNIYRRIIFSAGILFLLTSQTIEAARENKNIQKQLNQLLSTEPDLIGAIAGISIRTGANGSLIYDHLGEVRLRPASNLKLLTAAAALSILGENYQFKTEIWTNGKINKRSLKGNLYLKGKGDPTLLKGNLDEMAAEIQRQGIKKIQGDLIGDDSWYDDVRFSHDLPWSDETTYYGAPISALSVSANQDYNAGSVLFQIIPGKKAGDKPIVKMQPKTSKIKISNHAITVASNKKMKINIKREHFKNTTVIEGTIPMNAQPLREYVAVKEPTDHTLEIFRQSLVHRGIRLKGKSKRGITPNKAHLLTSHGSIPLKKLLVPFMKLSNNVHAEVLVKEMGKVQKGEGSWEKGLSILSKETAKFGVNTKDLVLRDGSGVSHVDLISANQITWLLFAIQKEPWFPSFQHSLPIAGEKEKMVGGSLRNRLKEPNIKGRVHAKTGTISTVSSLSGYVETISGQKLIFSILLNNLIDEDNGKNIEDKIVTILTQY